MHLKLYPLILFIFIISLLLCSCSDNDKNLEINIDKTREIVMIQGLALDIFRDIDNSARKRIPLNPFFEDTFSINKCLRDTLFPDNSAVFPKTLVLDYGAENCRNSSGVNKRGVILATFSQPYNESGAVVELFFNGYYVNDLRVDGDFQIVNLGQDTQGEWIFEINSTMLSFTDEAGPTVISIGIDAELITHEGNETVSVQSDDAWNVSGLFNGSLSDGSMYSIEIINPLRKNNNCFWIVAGIMNIASEEGNFSADFGNYTCDNIIVLNSEAINNYNTLIP